MNKVVVVGGGAAGMMAAYAASLFGNQVLLLEKNEKLGKKIYITGKGRCNFTNASDLETVLQAVVSHPKFLYSAFYTFSNEQVMDFFEENGMPYKIERGNRVFPLSDHASDVIRTLENVLDRNGVMIKLHTQVKEILTEKNGVCGVKTTDDTMYSANKVIVATGGISYPATGSTGDGYTFAEKLGHRVVALSPGLVPLVTKESYIPRLQGLSLKNVRLVIQSNQRILYEDFGEMMFTHFGITGPLVLRASSVIAKHLPKEQQAFIDLKPALSVAQLDERLLRIFKEHPKIHLKGVFQQLLPSKMIPVMIELSGISEDKCVCDYKKEEREILIKLLKEFPFTILSSRSFREAIITKGGVDVKQINPSTMESKLINGLYFAGEVLDLDAFTGGYNLQIAWSTGYLAGQSTKEDEI